MCGIAGVISSVRLDSSQHRLVSAMNESMTHRGPDSGGIFRHERVSLAMRRLAIIDPNGGNQPIYNEDKSVVIVCNGEIYNHDVLRQQLKLMGHSFRSCSDIEVIVHAYESFGVRCLDSLRGMFAFALWDHKHDRLMLARDRSGEKPLYLSKDGQGRLWFASEFRSILKTVRNPLLSPQALNLFLTFQYIPETDSPVDGITLMSAGHVLDLTPKNIHLDSKSYWDLSKAALSPSSPEVTVRESLNEACRLMGIADVPVAVAMSGGIDSSLVTALSAKHYPDQIEAFCVGYTQKPPTDERNVARGVAKSLRVPFHDIEINTDQVVRDFPLLVRAMDIPIGDIAAQGYFAVSSEARKKGFPVLLSGMGGDELFWGYDWVRQAVRRNTQKQSKKGLRGYLNSLFRKSLNSRPQFFEVHDEMRQNDLASRAILSREAAENVPQDLWLNVASLDSDQPAHFAVHTLLNRTWLQSNCLALVDRLSMFNSVEVRLPLLDHVLMEQVVGMRNAGLNDWRQIHKWLLLNSFKDIIPSDIIGRRKQGFTPPVEDWMSNIERRYLALVLDGALISTGLIDRGRLNSAVSSLSLNFKYKLMVAELWVRQTLLGESENDIHKAAARKHF